MNPNDANELVGESKSGRTPEYAVMVCGAEGEGVALASPSALTTGQVLRELLAGSELGTAICYF